MKKAVHLFLLAAIIFIAGCAHYSLEYGRDGKYTTVKSQGNLLSTMGGQGSVWFNFDKYFTNNSMFFTADIVYEHNGGAFNILKKKGVELFIDGKGPYFLEYKYIPFHSESTSQSGGGRWISNGMGGQIFIAEPVVVTVRSVEKVECILEPKHFKTLLKAHKIEILLVSGYDRRGRAEGQAAAFGHENFDNMMKFYSEQVAPANTAP